jgi:hypothetical protein
MAEAATAPQKANTHPSYLRWKRWTFRVWIPTVIETANRKPKNEFL